MVKFLAIFFVALCAQKFALAEIVECADHHRSQVEGVTVTTTKEVLYEEVHQVEKSAAGVSPHSNVTAGDCSVLGEELIHIHECVEPYANGVLTLTYNIQLTPSGTFENVAIYCIQIIDEVLDGDGGTATIEGGGIGFDFVDVKVQSQIGKGLAFLIEIYATSSKF